VQELKVRIYTLSTCSHCRAAKKLLSDLGVHYECTDVDLLPPDEKPFAMDEVRKLNPMCTFPTIVIGDKVIVGNREQEIKKALGL
jgi:glutaredoxin-like protein NrdH